MPEILEIRERERLESYRLLWRSLLADTREATFFQSLDWLMTFWRHHEHDQEFRVLVVSSAGEAIGVVPLACVTESTGVGGVRFLTYPLQDWGFFYGPIGPNPTATLVAAMRYLRGARRDWDVLDLRWIDRGGVDGGRTKRAMKMVGFHPHEQPWMRGAVVELPETWEEYWSARTPFFRKSVRRSKERLDQFGEVVHLRHRPEGVAFGDGDPRWDLYDACVEIAWRSWQSQPSSRKTLCSPEVRAFLRDCHEAASRVGALDLNLLTVRGRPAAFVYNYHFDRRVYRLCEGCSPEFQAVPADVVLEQMMLQDCISRGDVRYDMGTAAAEPNCHWATSEVTSYRVTHFPRTVARAQGLRLQRWYRRRFGDAEVPVAARFA